MSQRSKTYERLGEVSPSKVQKVSCKIEEEVISVGLDDVHYLSLAPISVVVSSFLSPARNHSLQNSQEGTKS